MNKAFWGHFKHFGRLLGKNNLFLTPSGTDRSQSDVCPKINGQFGSNYRANKYHVAGTLDNKSPQTPCTVSFPATLSFQGHIIFPKCPSQQNFACRTDIMRSRSIGCPWMNWNVLWKGIMGNFEQAQSRSLNLNSTQQKLTEESRQKKQQQQQQTGLTSLDKMQPARIFLIPVINYAVISNNCLWRVYLQK